VLTLLLRSGDGHGFDSIAVDDDSGGEFYLSTKVGQLVSFGNCSVGAGTVMVGEERVNLVFLEGYESGVYDAITLVLALCFPLVLIISQLVLELELVLLLLCYTYTRFLNVLSTDVRNE